jgi:ubiquitin-protein ligase
MTIALKKLASDLRDSVSGDYAEQFIIEPRRYKVITSEGTIDEEQDLFHWNGTLIGPDDTPYKGGYFKIEITIPDTYPNKPPFIRFLTKIYHPNIDIDGLICLNILRSPPTGDWKPSINLPKTVLSIHSLLSDPNPTDSLNADAGKTYLSDKEAFISIAKAWTVKYANKN